MRAFITETMCSENITRCRDLISDFVDSHPKACIYSAGSFIFVVWSCIYGKDVKQRIFAWFNKHAQKIKDERYEALRERLLEPLKKQKSHDLELLNENVIRILEVGAGTGTNLKFYPSGSHLVLVDPNPHFAKYYTENMNTSLKINPEDVIVAKGEAMDMVKSNSVDAVVVSLVLCSVQDVSKVANQIKRVLVPGGKFYFMEHVREWDTSKYRHRRIIQNILTWLRIWPFLFEGCCLNRDPLPIIKESGFSSVEAEYLYAPIVYKVWNFVSPHVLGVATK